MGPQLLGSARGFGRPKAAARRRGAPWLGPGPANLSLTVLFAIGLAVLALGVGAPVFNPFARGLLGQVAWSRNCTELSRVWAAG